MGMQHDLLVQCAGVLAENCRLHGVSVDLAGLVRLACEAF